jgi:hypothetical protein
MRDRIAKLLIGLAVVLILGDLAWALPRLAPSMLRAVRDSPETAILGTALALLVAAWLLRVGRGGERLGDGEERDAVP